MAKTYGVVSTKGGVGKTSLAANLGGILADMGQRVLLVDGDFQQTLSVYFKIRSQALFGLRALITRADPKDCISRTAIDHLDIVLSDDPGGKLIDWFRESASNVYYLAAALKKLDDEYDYILIDSQGARGILQQSIILPKSRIRVTLDQLKPYDNNPRTTRNPKFDDILASIENAGLDQPPNISRRSPDDLHYMIIDGGNTRLEILNLLYEKYTRLVESTDPRP